MKLMLLILPIMEIISLTPNTAIEPIKMVNGFTDIECSPIQVNNARVSFSSKFALKGKITRQYKAVLYFNDSNVSKTIFDFASDDRVLTYENTYAPNYISSGYIIFSIYSKLGKTLDSVTLNVSYYSTNDLSIFQSQEFVPETKYSCYSIEKGFYEKEEKFTYESNIEKDINVNEKPYIDLSSFRLKYSTEVSYYAELPYSSSLLIISNPDGIFNEVASSILSSSVSFSLTLNKDASTDEYYFAPTTSWYVDLQSGKMFNHDNGNCIKTNRIHIPQQYFSNISSWQGIISIVGMGFNYTTLIGSFNFIDGRNTFGSCDNSEYCVHEGSGESDYELGEVYEH